MDSDGRRRRRSDGGGRCLQRDQRADQPVHLHSQSLPLLKLRDGLRVMLATPLQMNDEKLAEGRPLVTRILR